MIIQSQIKHQKPYDHDSNDRERVGRIYRSLGRGMYSRILLGALLHMYADI